MTDFIWIVLTLLAAAALGWPVTAVVLRLARAVESSGPPFSEADPAADQNLDAGFGAEPQAVTDTAGPGGTVTPVRAGPIRRAPAPGSVLRGGLMIGVLERLAVAGAILGSEPVAIAYVVAIKGLGRYAELKETPAAAERFIIGTLASMLWAVAVATAARAFLL
ncbi:hypothetical protein MUG94_05635 [Arthrobacter gengyunqii]|uniref:Uncharacterized protein n=1 Tax=Arthrobacter gengyunqii TaxID=2886940 RepID=A0A9X1S892_9MICC|nr:hypothetical protein [Arthrobacter gengyunqii]MCC3269789.1 hypothetical protein [Arthrobacter gengyunqii]UOY97239.1 hypothetical protein MUG94_05635 [Arthrobacter gengyunqii]